MRGLRVLFIGLVIAALYVPAAQTQTRRGQQRQQGAQVQMPRMGAVSMIGVRLSDVTADNMKTLKVSRIEGAVVEGVNPNSPAATAGLHEKDVIVQFDGERVRSASHLTRLVNETPAGREVTLSVMRDGRRSDLRIKPEAGTSWFDPRFGGMIDQEQWREYAEQAGRAAREMSQNLPEMMPGMRGEMVWRLGRGRLGATVQELTPELAEYFGVKSGTLVTTVAQDSPAGKAGLKAGDVITAVDGKSIATPGELLRALPARDQARDVSLTVVRDKKEMTLTVSLAPARQQQGRPI
jgi:S1-C subfamily serine protease